MRSLVAELEEGFIFQFFGVDVRVNYLKQKYWTYYLIYFYRKYDQSFQTLISKLKSVLWILKDFYLGNYIGKDNKKHSENSDTSTSATFDLEAWPWTYVKVKKAYVIRCRLLYRTLIPGFLSVGAILYEIWPFVHFCDIWPS